MPLDLHAFHNADVTASQRSSNQQVIVAQDAYSNKLRDAQPKLTPEQKRARTREIQAQI
ncbi:MAG: hypothetical protein HC765_15515, partial [Brachymonas sp.]|nr:hypothetical protein [Brachymonas sp.]